MDPERFDTLTRALSTAGPRRGLLRVLAAVPLAGGVFALLEQAGVQGYDHRDGQRGKRGPGGKGKDGGDDKGKDGKDRKNRDKDKRTICQSESRASTCHRRCGTVRNNCGHRVDCGPCACDPPCEACFICDPVKGTCIVDDSQMGDRCDTCKVCQDDGSCQACPGCCDDAGDCQPGTSESACGTNAGECLPCEEGQECGGDGRCACTATSCGDGRRCDENRCVCDSDSCRDGCCDAVGICHIDDDAACGTDGGGCTDCAASNLACQSGTCACTKTSCQNGCCTQAGACLRHADQSVTACGTDGDTCGSCPTSETCRTATCAAGQCGIALSTDNASGPGCADPDVCCQGSCCTNGTTCDAGGACVCPASAPHDCNQDGICQECCADGDCSGIDYCENNDCTTCHPTPTLCDRDEQCCDFYDGTGDCSGPGFPELPGSKNCCRFFGESCRTGSDCCSLICDDFAGFTDVCLCLTGGSSCTSDRNCCSGRCENGKCACNPAGTPCEPNVLGLFSCCGICDLDHNGGFVCK